MQGRSVPQAGSPEQMCWAGSPQRWPAGNVWDSSWGWVLPIIKIYNSHTGRDEPALRIRCLYFSLPLEVRCPNLSSKPRQVEVPCLSEGKGASPFSNRVQALLLEEIWIPSAYKDPLRTGLLTLPVEGESVLPNSYFTWWNQATTGLLNMKKNMDTAVPGAQARTFLPWGRSMGPACLPPFGRFLERSCVPLPWAMPSSQQIPFPQEAEGCLSFWHLSSPPLSFRLCCSGCLWGSLMDFHTCCPQLLVAGVNSCRLQPLGSSHLP